jgi:hypothetical protein
MDWVRPQYVTSPRRSWRLDRVLVAGPEEGPSVAIGEWHGGGQEDGRRVLAMRWNGTREHPKGTPQSRGYPTWFVVPSEYRSKLLEALGEEEQRLAREWLGI